MTNVPVHSGQTRLAGVVGWPVAHSRSPRLHGYWLDRHRIDGAYLPLPVEPRHFAGALRALPWLGFAGVNVTLPHKEAALTAVDAVTRTAARAGAVNTVIVEPGGGLLGDNTDGFGFLENLRAGQAGWSASQGPAVVLGAGGAARAVAAALLDAGAPELRVLNRNRARAEALAEALGGPIVVADWHQRHDVLDGAALLVNATTLGMAGQPDLDINLGLLPKPAWVTDLVYTPLETPLLTRARRDGHPVADGLGMLLHQGRGGFKAWFGPDPDVTEALRAFVLNAAVAP